MRVFTPDRNIRIIKLKFGSNTTADSVLELTLTSLKIDLEVGREVFAIWVVSKNLELQLTPTHKPVKLDLLLFTCFSSLVYSASYL